MFDIQKFGENDTLTSANELKLNFAFEDGDTRLVTLPNPKPGLTGTQIAEVGTWAHTNQPIIGDRAGASTTGIFEAYKLETSKLQLDLT